MLMHRIQMKKIILIFLIFTIKLSATYKHYFAIPSDERHFHMLENLIGSIHKNDKEALGEIMVFDIGLSLNQRNKINTMYKTKVYALEEMKNKTLVYFNTSPEGRAVRGYFAWKPVVIKQALDIYPYILYMDAGTTLLKNPDIIFAEIIRKGHFLLSCTANENCNIANRITDPVISYIKAIFPEYYEQLMLPTTTMIDAGLQGVSRAIINQYIMPIYNLTDNLELFKDDGSAKYGYGAGRHDQTLFSIFAHVLKLKIYPEGFFNIQLDGENYRCHMQWDAAEVNDETIIFRSRHDIHFKGGHSKYIIYEN